MKNSEIQLPAKWVINTMEEKHVDINNNPLAVGSKYEVEMFPNVFENAIVIQPYYSPMFVFYEREGDENPCELVTYYKPEQIRPL